MATSTETVQDGFPAFSKLPNEIRLEVLKKLENEDLMNCTLTSFDINCLIGDLREKAWRPYFPRNYNAGVDMLFRRRWIGTRFFTIEDINTFMERNADFNLNEGLSPFENGTLILFGESTVKYDQMHERLPVLIERFGNHIKHCLFYVNAASPHCLNNISLIFRMSNLVSLTMASDETTWNFDRIQHHWDEMKTWPIELKQLRHLVNLDIIGSHGFKIIMPIFNACVHQIKRLYINSQYTDAIACRSDHPIKNFPNLEELKIGEATVELLFCLSSRPRVWPLKRLSVRLCHLSVDSFIIPRVLKAISPFSPTLEYFHLSLISKHPVECNFVEEFKFKFLKVKSLRVPYQFVKSEKGITDLFITASFFPNITHLQLVDDLPTDIFEKRRLEHEALTHVLQTMWDKLPQNLEIITVRFKAVLHEFARAKTYVMKETKPKSEQS